MNPLEMAINDDSVLSKRIIEIMLKDPNNVFSIYTIEDVDNYEKKRKEISFKILEGKNEDFGEHINEMPIENRKRFALLELLYGIDYDQAENLIKKYGENINELKTDSAKEESLKQYIIQLKYIMNLDDKTIDQMMKNEEFKSFLQNAEIPEIASSITIQKDIVKLYEKAFNKKIAKSSIPKKDSIVFEGKEIPIEIYSPIDENGNFTYTEFATFIRQEGAYVNWENQDNYADYFNTQSALEHGNCESFINQSQIATANCSGGPKSGYDHTGDITMMAAWDIGSSTANEKSSSISSSWKTNNGIEFRTPDEFINYTRHGHNESVSDRIQRITERGIEKRRPGKSIFIKERYNETENELGEIRASEWTEDRKMAKEMGSKISIIDREGFAIQEEMTIQYDLEMLGGPKVEELAGIKDIERLTGKKCQKVDWSQKADLSHEELIREIIVRFENNAIGMMYSDIKDEYFTDEKREYVVNALMKTIEKEREVDINQYYKDLETVERVIEEEKNKEVTNNGSRVYITPKIYMEVAHRINTILVQDKKREDIFQIENKKELREIIDFIYDSKIYDDNKLHSTDHIVKTTLFADILAQNEGLSEREKNLIVTAAALHDSGREGNDGNKPHATLSAEKAKKILADENNIFKAKDFTEDEIKIIQAVIEYHEVKEFKKGKIKMETTPYPKNETDYGLNYFMQKYGLSKDNLPTVAKLCGILKDADALDRERFSGLESSTNISFLHTKTAKDIRTIVYADRINNQTASRLLGKYYDYNSADINAVKKLKDKRVENKSTTNQRLSKEEMYNVFSEMGIDLESDRSINFIRKQYDEEIIGTEDVQSAVNYIKQEYEKLITEKMMEGDKGESGR